MNYLTVHGVLGDARGRGVGVGAVGQGLEGGEGEEIVDEVVEGVVLSFRFFFFFPAWFSRYVEFSIHETSFYLQPLLSNRS